MAEITSTLPPPAASRYAGFWIRFVARLIDSLIFLVPFGILFGVLAASGALQVTCTPNPSGFGSSCSAGPAGILLYLVLIVASLLYYPVLWGSGGTLGQRMLSLHVVDANTGQHIGTGRGFLRLLGYLISSIPCDLGLIWAGFDSRKQGWHDKIATTVVVRT